MFELSFHALRRSTPCFFSLELSSNQDFLMRILPNGSGPLGPASFAAAAAPRVSVVQPPLLGPSVPIFFTGPPGGQVPTCSCSPAHWIASSQHPKGCPGPRPGPGGDGWSAGLPRKAKRLPLEPTGVLCGFAVAVGGGGGGQAGTR